MTNLDENLCASVCISRDDKGAYYILSPCDVYQERLLFWGDRVEAAVPRDDDTTNWQMKTLAELQPTYWGQPFLTDHRN